MSGAVGQSPQNLSGRFLRGSSGDGARSLQPCLTEVWDGAMVRRRRSQVGTEREGLMARRDPTHQSESWPLSEPRSNCWQPLPWPKRCRGRRMYWPGDRWLKTPLTAPVHEQTGLADEHRSDRLRPDLRLIGGELRLQSRQSGRFGELCRWP